jgi:hypothetical protein
MCSWGSQWASDRTLRCLHNGWGPELCRALCGPQAQFARSEVCASR